MAYSTVTAAQPATEKQIAYIVVLLADRVYSGAKSDEDVMHQQERIGELHAEGRVTKGSASTMIALLLKSPKRIPDGGEVQTRAEVGYYANDGRVYVVVENKQGTNTYAKRLVIFTDAAGKNRGRWEYAPGIANALRNMKPLTEKEAAKLGRKYGVCMVCARTLTDPESVKRGIGPVCAARL